MISGPEAAITEPDRKFGKIILDHIEESPDHVNQVDPISGRCLTFREMRDSSIRCALWLRKQNVGAGDVVSFCGNDRIDAYIPLLASVYVGSIFNGWDYKIALLPARKLMNQIKPKIIFCIENSLDVLMEAANLEKLDIKFVVFDKSERSSKSECLNDILERQSTKNVDNFVPRELDSLDEPGLITFSSGTTGLPKGVLISYRTMSWWLGEKSSFGNTVTMGTNSFLWISGVTSTIRSIMSKSKRIISGDLDVVESLKMMENYKVNMASLTPSNLTRLSKSRILQTKKYPLASLKFMMFGGSPLSQQILDDLKTSLPHVTFLNFYGMTEICGCCSISRDKTSAGYLTTNFKLKVIDPDTLEVLSSGKIGELCFWGPAMMLGYYNNPSATEQAFDSDGFFRSGDLGYYKEDGEIFLTGRLKELIKYRNYQVSPPELENHLLTHPAVEEVAVVPKEDLEDGQRPMAFVVKSKKAEITENELVEYSSKLGIHQTLRGGVKFLDDLPRTVTGKVYKKLLWDMANDCN